MYLLPPFTLPQDNEVKIVVGDALAMLRMIPSNSIHCVVTSPPYWGLRDYGVAGQLGLEATPDEYVANMVTVFREVRRVLREDGNCFVNIGDSYIGSTSQHKGADTQGHNSVIAAGTYASVPGNGRKERVLASMNDGLKQKDKALIPFRLALALQSDGWWVRQDNIWHKPNAMPESVRDRTTTAHEYVFHLTKSARYFYDADAIAEPSIWTEDRRAGNGRHTYNGKFDGTAVETQQQSFVIINPTKNKRSVWEISSKAYKGAHFAVFPPELAEIPIKCGCPEGGIVLDCFAGAGTTGLVASRHNRRALLIELSSEYAELARKRIYSDAPLFNVVEVA